MHLALCSGRLPSRRMEKCTQHLLRPIIFPWKSGYYFFEPLVLCSTVSCAQSPLVDFLGALDDEEFFVVEGSGGGGVAGSLTPR